MPASSAVCTTPGVWEDMARSLEARRQQPLQAVRFRNKVAGWKDSHFTAVYGEGTDVRITLPAAPPEK